MQLKPWHLINAVAAAALLAMPASRSHARHLHEPPWLGWLVLEHTGNGPLAHWGTLGAHWEGTGSTSPVLWSTLGTHWVALEASFLSSGTHWENGASPLDHNGSILGASCLSSGSHWEHTGLALGAHWIALGAHWDHAGLTLGAHGDHAGLTLGARRLPCGSAGGRSTEHAACPHMAFFRFTNMRAPSTRRLPPSFPVSHQPRHRHRGRESRRRRRRFPPWCC